MFKSKNKATLPICLNNDVVLRVENLSKKFCRTLKRSIFYGTVDIARSMLGLHCKTWELRRDEFWALNDISFELHKGETLGIIGVNGSGKSTLLRLITGIFPPDKGKIYHIGRVGALIAVGAGFHPHMTGRENIYLNGTILGMSRKEIDAKFNDIADFADIGDFLEAPVSTYSSGMTVRLGFAIAIHCEPDVLLVDEILAVGDVGFQLKCFNIIGELKRNGTSIIIVSHNLHLMATYCDRIILMDKGRSIYLGDIDKAISTYKSRIASLQSEGEIEKVATGNADFKIIDVKFEPEMIENVITMKSGGNLRYTIIYESKREYQNIEIDTVLRIPVPSTVDYFQLSNKAIKKRIDIKNGHGQLGVVVNNINLKDMRAYLFITVWMDNRSEILLWWRNIPIQVEGTNLGQGWSNYQVEYFQKN